MATAEVSARWHSPTEVRLDHTSLSGDDTGWLSGIEWLTLWSVKVPQGFLASLPRLRYLDIRGGSAPSLAAVEGCTALRYLQVNQVRGLTDLSAVPALHELLMLSLYGLPKVQTVPSLAPLHRLARVQLGSLKGLTGLTGVHDAPALRELQLIRSVAVDGQDASGLARHSTLERFDWFGEDVPVRQWQPFVAAVGKAPAKTVDAKGWLRHHGEPL